MGMMRNGVVKERRDKDLNPMMHGRIYRMAPDQHGRLWGAEIDKRTDQPCGPLRAYFCAPWIPDAQYVKWTTDEQTTAPSVFLDYPEMKGDRKQAQRAWFSNFMQIGVALDKELFDPENPSQKVRMASPPRPAPVEVVVAAERGDPWLIGESQVMPKWAVPYFRTEEEDEAAFLFEHPEPATGAAEDEDLEEDVAPTPRPRRARARQKRAA